MARTIPWFAAVRARLVCWSLVVALLGCFTNGGLDGNTNAGGYDAFVVKVETSGRRR